jgi:flagellin
MSSINTNMAAMNALSALRNINMNMTETQGRISTGYKVSSGKDNAAYFQISTTMRSESSMLCDHQRKHGAGQRLHVHRASGR